jgi:protein TonB
MGKPATQKPLPKVVPVKPAKYVPVVPPEKRQMPQENRVAPVEVIDPLPTVLDAPPPASAQAPAQPMPSALPDTSILTQVATPAIAPNPQRFVRETGAAPAAAQGAANGVRGGQGSETTSTNGSPEEARARYEQQISAWIQQHKLYPADAGGKEGRVVVRMRIDRAGYVRFYALEQASGIAPLDAAAIDMVRRANPVPAVPSDYPAGNLIEFLIPITFRAPR